MEGSKLKEAKRPISTRGKIAMLIVVLVGIIYWLMSKIEIWIGSLYEKRAKNQKQVDEKQVNQKEEQ